VNIGIGVIIESLVAVLLMVTIAYCTLLNRRLQRLKADEHTLKATISELITATEIAERAIAGLKVTVQECDSSLGQRLKAAETMTSEISRYIGAGEQVLTKIGQITAAARALHAPGAPAAIAADAQNTVAAAQAFAARSRLRTQGAAA
jgi:hypothetical protein